MLFPCCALPRRHVRDKTPPSDWPLSSESPKPDTSVPFSSAAPHQGERLLNHLVNPQLGSPLVAKLSTEIRFMIFEYVLPDPTRLLHVYRTKKKNYRPIAHSWCTDMDSPLPKWQHPCFGKGQVNTSYRHDPRPNSSGLPFLTSNDKLLSLVLSCRAL